MIGPQNPPGSTKLRLFLPSIFAGVIAILPEKELLAALLPLVMLEEALYHAFPGAFNFNGFRRCNPISTRE